MNLVSCPRCKLSLIIDEYRSHACKKAFTGVKTIPMQYFFEKTIDENFDELIMAKGEDGILYHLIKCEHSIPHNLPKQPTGNRNKTTDNETEPEITPTKTEILV